MTYTLFGARRSGSCAVECALAETGAEYACVDIDLASNQQLAEAYSTVNPARKIPALRLPSGTLLTESSAILVTIADRHPEAKLLPAEASDARAAALRWIAFCASEIYPLIEIIDYPERFCRAGDGAEALREAARTRIRQRWPILEKAIAGKPWILDAGFTVADLYAANLSRWDVGAEWRCENCPGLDAIAAAIAARPKSGPVWQRHFG